MAAPVEGAYMVTVSLNSEKAEKSADNLATSLKGVGASVDKAGSATKTLSTGFLAISGAMVGTATTAMTLGGALETAMFRSRSAIEQTGMAVEDLTKSLNAAGIAAAELLPVAAKFAIFGFSADEMERATKVGREMAIVMGMSSQKVGMALASVAGPLGAKTESQLRRLGAGLMELELRYQGTFDANTQLLKTQGRYSAEVGLTASALLGANSAMMGYNISAGDANAVMTRIVNQFRIGGDQASRFAEMFSMSGAELDRFNAASTTGTEKMRMLWATMKDMNPQIDAFRVSSALAVDVDLATQLIHLAQTGAMVEDAIAAATAGFSDAAMISQRYGERTKELGGAMRVLWERVRAAGEAIGQYLVPIATLAVRGLTLFFDLVAKFPKLSAFAVAVMGVVGSAGLLARVMSTSMGEGFLKGTLAVTNWIKAMLVGNAVTKAAAREQMGLAFARSKDAAATALQILKNVFLIGKMLIVKGLTLIMTPLTLLLALAKKVLQKSIYGSGVVTAMMMEVLWRGYNIASMVIENTWLGIVTVAKGVYAAATTVASIATGVFTGTLGFLSLAAGVATGAFTALAVAVWTALAPLIPFILVGALIVAAVAAIGYGIYKLVGFLSDNWDVIWGGMATAVGAVWDVLMAGWDVMVAIGNAITNFLIAPIKALWGMLAGAAETVAAPFKAIWAWLSPISDAIGSIVGAMFGSSMFHIKEGVSEITPSLKHLEGSFQGVGKAAAGVGVGAEVPAGVGAGGAGGAAGGAGGGFASPILGQLLEYVGGIWRIMALANPLAALAAQIVAGPRILEGTQAFGGSAGGGAKAGIEKPPATKGAAGAGEGVSGGAVRIVVPVTLVLDGEKIGHAVSEYELDLGAERYMNIPGDALRGTGR